MPENNYYSILRHTDDIVDDFFGVRENGLQARYGTRTTFLKRNLESTTGNAESMLIAIHEQIAANWLGRSYLKCPSLENWRRMASTDYNRDRAGLEVILEREIVKAMGSPPYFNNVPTSSGYCGPNHDKARNVDLVYEDRDGLSYTFIELKWDADHPVFAAVEVILRGVLNVFCRLNREQLGYSVEHSRMLSSPAIHLKVLGPQAYFTGDNIHLGWLEKKLNAGLHDYCKHYSDSRVQLDFAFESFPLGFLPPFTPEKVREAMKDRSPAYPS